MEITQVGGMLEDLAGAWSDHDIEKLLSLCTDDCIYEDVTMGAVNRGKAAVRQFADVVFAAFPDFKIELISGFITGDWAGAEWTMSGTHKGDLPGLPATGKAFSLRDAARPHELWRSESGFTIVTAAEPAGSEEWMRQQ